MKKKILFLVSIFVCICLILFFLYRSFDEKKKKVIKNYLFPYKFISEQNFLLDQKDQLIAEKEQKIEEQRVELSQIRANLDLNLFEVNFQNKLADFKTKKRENINLKNKKVLLKFQFKNGFYSGIKKFYPGSGFIDFYFNDLVVLSARGVLGVSKNAHKIKDDFVFKQIDHNIYDFIGLEQFNKKRWFSIKDMTIIKNKIFVSYTEEIKTDCWNTSIIAGEINLKKINFKKFFSSSDCIHVKNNPDKEFGGWQAGGRIVDFDENYLFFSVGDYRARYLVQDNNSINGKVIKINKENSNYDIISIGHRNPQGLYYDKEFGFILETEHGPRGGDEINFINLNYNSNDKIQNFGWPIVSAGEHYGKKSDNIEKYKKYPLYKSHKKYGFIEPLKTFVPSIGISEVRKLNKKNYVFSSLKNRSLYFFRIENKKLKELSKLKINERIRDIAIKNNKLFLFLEDTSSIGIIDLSS